MIHSMTGFASRTFTHAGQSYKVEVKTLNHRFLELKLRTPREWSSFEPMLRTLVESKLKRGTVELWVEKLADANASGTSSDVRVSLPQAEAAHAMLLQLQHRFNISEGISIRDLMSFPDVITKTSAVPVTEAQLAELKVRLLAEVSQTLDELVKMRAQEGKKLQTALLEINQHFKNAHDRFLSQRNGLQAKSKEKIKRKIEQCFEAYSTPDAQVRALMETRIAQEISIAIDKSDIEEELTRFKGHVDQIGTILTVGGPVGKKLDFMFQELNREINTLGNKAQDLDVSQDVISLKMWVEQMREQSLNLE